MLLITSRSGRNGVIPKGLVEDDLTPLESARCEALEEAGIEGIVFDVSIGDYEYPNREGICRVQVYPMLVQTVHESWQEDFRIRRWFLAEDADIMVESNGLRRYLREFEGFLAEHGLIERNAHT